ncbi:MAG: biopolymer transporter ExbD [Pseudomonadota bacterium]
MNLSQRQREEPQVNLTSLIDVVLLLLVFFMITTSFVRESSVTIKLPEATSEAESVPVDIERLEITITSDDRYYVNNRELINTAPSTLERALEELAGGREGLPVTILADADARHQIVVRAMDVAASLGFTQVNIATVEPADD